MVTSRTGIQMLSIEGSGRGMFMRERSFASYTGLEQRVTMIQGEVGVLPQ